MATRDPGTGRFVKGNQGGPGRPRREVELAYLNATIAQVTPDDWQKVIDKALAQAMKGNAEARRFLAEYLVGKPVQRNELTGEDGGPLTWKQVVEQALNDGSTPEDADA